MKKKNILVYAKMSNNSLRRILLPLSKSDVVDSIYLLRNKPLNLEKVININPPKFLQNNIVLSELYRFIISFKVFLSKDIDYIMSIQLTFHGYFGYIFSKLFRKKHVFNMVECEGKIFTSKIAKISQFILGRVDTIITRGTISTKNLQKIYKNTNIADIPIYIDVPDKNNYSYKNEYDLVFLGSFTVSKRTDILIDAINIVVKNKLPNLSIALGGNGPLKSTMINKVMNYGITQNIDFLDWVENPYLLITSSKAMIMTSEYDGLPLAMIESLLLGIPCIISNVCNIPDLAIDGYNALLVEPLDTEGFAEAIYKLMTDDELYKRLKKGAENFRQEHEYEFSMENITNIWNDIFIKLGLIEKENTNANK